MPTPIGHALAGAAVALASPSARGRHADPWKLVALCAALAALPDADLLFGSHRTVTHSLLSVAIVTILAMAVTGQVTRSKLTGDFRTVAIVCGVAWGSHILLDWLGADTNAPRGQQMLWPFSDRWFISEWDVFRRVERRDPFSVATVRVNVIAVAQEVAIMTPVTLAAWWYGRRRELRSKKYELRSMNDE
jgi:membrane-bound metal-dependent hydrolase YbcI (DUF457 family)